MNHQTSHTARKFIFTVLVALSITHSHAADSCPGAFDSKTLSSSLELESFHVAKSILIAVKVFLNYLSHHAKYSKNDRKETTQLHKEQQLDKIENEILNIDNTIDKLNDQVITINKLISQSSHLQKETFLLTSLEKVRIILSEEVEVFIQPIKKETENALNKNTDDQVDKELLYYIKESLESDKGELRRLIKGIENKIDYLMIKNNNFSQPNNARQVNANEQQEEQSILASSLNPRQSANKITEHITSISRESKTFDIFTRDSIQLILLQYYKSSFENYQKAIYKLSEETKNLIAQIKNILHTSQSNRKTQSRFFRIKSLQDKQEALEESHLQLTNTTKLIEDSINIITIQLQHPSHKDREMDHRVNETEIKTLVEEIFLNVIETKEVANELSKIKTQNAITQAKISSHSSL